MFIYLTQINSKLIDWLERNSKPCFYKKNFGIDCLGCGFQRSAISLLKGNLLESFSYYPALIPIIIMFVLLIAHLRFNFNNGALILKFLFSLNIALIIGNFIFKLTQ